MCSGNELSRSYLKHRVSVVYGLHIRYKMIHPHLDSNPLSHFVPAQGQAHSSSAPCRQPSPSLLKDVLIGCSILGLALFPFNLSRVVFIQFLAFLTSDETRFPVLFLISLKATNPAGVKLCVQFSVLHRTKGFSSC